MPETPATPARQRLGQLLIDTVLLDAAAAVEYQQAAACRDKLRQCGDLALPKQMRVGLAYWKLYTAEPSVECMQGIVRQPTHRVKNGSKPSKW